MELNEFVTNFADQFNDTPIEDFSPDTRFRELEEWDSLTALSVIAMVDEEYEKQLTGAEIRSVTTIHQLFELLASK